MVPGTPSVAVVCRGSTRKVVSGTQLSALVTDLNEPGIPSRGCQAIALPAWWLYFDYPSGTSQLVTLSPGDCGIVSNGKRGRNTGPDLGPFLDRL
jgi:hypothetical protein